MVRKTPQFDYTDCLSCGMCVQECPVSCLAMTKPGKRGKYPNVFPQRVKEDCLGCGRCAQICPMGVITMHEN